MHRRSPLDAGEQARRLRIFLRWLTPLAGLFALVELVAWRAFDDDGSLTAAVVLWAYVIVAGVTLLRLRDDRLTEAGLTLSVGILGAAVLLAVVQPAVYPALIVVTIIAAGLSLSYLGGQALRLSLTASWISAIAIIAVAIGSATSSPLPAWFVAVFDVAAVAATTGLALVLLAQSRDRLTDALAEARRANDELQVAQAERLAAERRLAAQERHQSLGVLAGGIAHDFNNLLTAVIGNADLLRADLPHPTPPSIDGSLVAIQTSARRAADLARQMQAYAGQHALALELLDPAEVVHGLMADLRPGIDRGIALEATAARGATARIQADRDRLADAIANLVSNAVDALMSVSPPDAPAGTVRISVGEWRITGPADLPHGTVALEPIEAGRYVTIAVADTGPGVPPDIARRMFEPFVTSRFMGRGLGLAVVLGVVRSHGGSLVVRSVPGHGTTVTILLPLAV